MVKHLAISFALLFQIYETTAQGEANNWVFGNRCWITFPTNQPVVNAIPSSFNFGSASISDKNGQLLFYTDGQYVYNKLHQVMPSCGLSGLMGIQFSATPIMIIPYPAHDSLYYIFYVENWWAANYVPRLRYSIVNMNLQNGLGDLDQMDILVNNDFIAPKFTAVLHCNKRDVWLVGHYRESDRYFSYLITKAGLSSSPVLSLGNMVTGAGLKGHMKSSPGGDKIATAYRGSMDCIELMDFNNQTGELTNSKTITVTPSWNYPLSFHDTGPYGVEFSPSGKYLYVSSTYDVQPSGYAFGHIHQFDVSSNTVTTIQASRVLIDSTRQLPGFAGMQLASNGKIYIATYTEYLSCVNNPESQGSACNFVRLQLIAGTNTKEQLPGFMQSYFRYPIIATGNCQFQSISFSIQNMLDVGSVLWDFGDTASGNNNISSSFAPTHIFSAKGAFLVKAILMNSNGCGADTITKIVHAGSLQVFLGNDTIICKGDSVQLRMNIPGAFSIWSNGVTDTAIYVGKSGTYWLQVNLGGCSASDTIRVTVGQLPAFSLGPDTTICSNRILNLSPNIISPSSAYQWNTGDTSTAIIAYTEGLYWLQVTDPYNCLYKDSIVVRHRPQPQFTLGADTLLCQANLSLSVALSNVNSYLWSTGAGTSTINVKQSGLYWAEVSKDNCIYRDSILVMFKAVPVVNLGSDTILCEQQSFMLDAHNLGSTYLWQSGSSDQTFLVSEPGIYYVKVNLAGCISEDTIQIRYKLKPVFSLGPDLQICSGQSIVLAPIGLNAQPVSYWWQDGSSKSSLAVSVPSLYSLQLTNECGSKIDTVLVSKGLCQLFVPNAFSPNNDGLNDIFKPSFVENISHYELYIYNRWGQIIYSSSEIHKGWNGVYKGIFQPSGVYIWMIKYKTVDSSPMQSIKGNVMLLR
jgi:gliding motility-associated-like protein